MDYRGGDALMYADEAVTMWGAGDDDTLQQVSRAPDWTSATCASVGGDAWFPGPHGEGSFHAKLICSACPIRAACLEYANVNEIREGIWGGLAYAERLDVKFGRVAA
jgi:WhiB family transcriptional regulator, redox-sensing transcriptional regulator